MDEPSLTNSTLGDRYRLMEVIGEGGMGRVFRAEQLATGRKVAVKLLHPEFVGVDQVVQRFEREAKVTTQLSHPHIVKVVEFGAWNGRLFLAMELLAGRSLAALIERDGQRAGRRLSVKRTVAIMRPVLEALDYAHTLGVVHRDLKPENIMIVPARGLFPREAIKLLDFGIAKLGDSAEAAAQKLTQHGLVLGTPAYMSPEQAAGQQADVRSDLYACGVIMYQMLTGQRPFQADTSLEVLAMHVNTAPRSLRAVAPDTRISPGVERVVLRALAKRPAERFQSARELRQALERAALGRDDPGVSGIETTMLATAPAPQARPAARTPRFRWIQISIIVVAMAMLLGNHLRFAVSGGGRRALSSTAGDAARRSHVIAGAEPPTPSRDRVRAASKKPAGRNR